MKYFLFVIFMVTLCPWTTAQKVGHINFGNLLESLPAIKQANELLTNYQDSLGVALETRVKAHRARIEENQQKFKAGELTRVEADAINKSLNEEQSKLVDDQKKSELTIMIRKQGYLQPIVAEVKEAIALYGKENGYHFIFDESSGVMLFDRPSEDLTETIRNVLVNK